MDVIWFQSVHRNGFRPGSDEYCIAFWMSLQYSVGGRHIVPLAEHVAYRPSEKPGCKISSPLEHILIFFRVVLSTWVVDFQNVVEALKEIRSR